MNAAAPRRVGLFGGAFDPPHGAHVALARAAVEQLGLDRLHVAPTGMAWHKAQTLSAAAHRLAMCRLAFGGLPKVFVDDRELRRDGPTYTIDTLAELRAQYPGAELFLQIGADQAAAFHTWRRAGEIVDMAVISIAVRADVEPCAFPFGGRGQRDEGVLPLPPLGEGWDGGYGVTTGHAAGPLLQSAAQPEAVPVRAVQRRAGAFGAAALTLAWHADHGTGGRIQLPFLG